MRLKDSKKTNLQVVQAFVFMKSSEFLKILFYSEFVFLFFFFVSFDFIIYFSYTPLLRGRM